MHRLNFNSTAFFNLTTGFSGFGGTNRDRLITIETLTLGGDAQVTGLAADNIITLDDADGVGANTITGEGGNDTILAGGGDDSVSGRTGNDRLTGGVGVDSVDGGAGNGIVTVGISADMTSGGADADRLILTGVADLVTLCMPTGAAGAFAARHFATVAIGTVLTAGEFMVI